MKILLIAIAIFTAAPGFQQKTGTVRVWGNCEMCKSRIEKALKAEGISKADWNIESKMLTITYDSHKISLDQIQQKVAGAGHDTEKFRAENKTYDKLPGCCRYQREKEKEVN